MKWEYESIHPKRMNVDNDHPVHKKYRDYASLFLMYLREAGAAGWEFCGYDPVGNALFKRPEGSRDGD